MILCLITEHASMQRITEKSDVYSFGILIMEIISGRNPVDYSRPQEEVFLQISLSFCQFDTAAAICSYFLFL